MEHSSRGDSPAGGSSGEDHIPVAAARAQPVGAAIYVDLLREALDSWRWVLDDEALFDHVRACRVALLKAASPSHDAYLALAEEIAYDRALVRYCEGQGLSVNLELFTNPLLARARLERELRAREQNVTDRC